ncbi:uncharacterized protein [Lolium perenne]|uniref:uncharacterized protein n=1 Tax=Lolium perenne TaxID=4522 RepID=UPI003A995C9E
MKRRIEASSASATAERRGWRSSPWATTVATEACCRVQWEKRAGRRGKVYKDFVGSAIYVAPEVLHRNYGREIDVWSAGVILYILLCGSPPFWAETEKGIFDAILVGKVDFYTSPWPAISGSAKDLIRQMLNRDPKKRITAVQALEHPWLKEGGASHGPMDGAAILKAKQFKETNKLKQLAAKSTAEKISPEEIEGLKQMFRNMDTDKSGKITLEELRIGLTSKISEPEVQKLMEAVDVDKSGNVDYTEFLATMMNKHKVEKEEDLLLPFQHFDKDNNGHATHGEKDGTRVIETSKSSGMKNEKKEAEPELNKPENANVIMEDVPSSQAEFEKKLEEELRKKLLGQKLAGGTGVSISGNDEQHVLQDNNMHDTGDDGGLGKTEKEVNNYEYQDKNHGGIADITDDKIKGGTVVSISGNNEQHVLQDNNMHDTGDDGGLGKTEKEVNNYEYQDKNHGGIADTTDDKIKGGTGVSISGNNEQHVLQDNNMHDTGDDGELGKTEKEVNNYEYQDKNHGGVADITDDKIKGGTGVSISGNNEQHVLQDNNIHDTGVDGGLEKTEKEVNNYEYQDKNHAGMEDITDDKINSDAFSRKHEYSAQQIQESNQDGGTDTDESDSGTLAGEKYIEDVNSSQVTTGVDKENFVEIGRRISGRTNTYHMMDNAVERSAKNLETVPGENALPTFFNSSYELIIALLIRLVLI